MKVLYTIADLQPESGGPSRSVAALAAAVAAQVGSFDASVFSAPSASPRDSFLAGQREAVFQCFGVSVVALDYGSEASKPMLPKPPVQTILVPCRGVLGRKLKWSSTFSAALLREMAGNGEWAEDGREESRKQKAEGRNAETAEDGGQGARGRGQRTEDRTRHRNIEAPTNRPTEPPPPRRAIAPRSTLDAPRSPSPIPPAPRSPLPP